MQLPTLSIGAILRAALLACCGLFAVGSAGADDAALRAKAVKLMNDGNLREAFDAYRQLAHDPDTDPRQVGNDLQQAFLAQQQLGETAGFDELVEGAIEAHGRNWRLLEAAATLHQQVEHIGYRIGGEYRRGYGDGSGTVLNSFDRDRVRALQLMNQALSRAVDEDDKAEVASFMLRFAGLIQQGDFYGRSWKLQSLTDLSTLPDFEEGYSWYDGSTRGAPVDAEGNPVVYRVPKSWEAAVSDGERWRWLLAMAIENAPSTRPQVDSTIAAFAQQQFGVQTMQQFSWFRPYGGDDGAERPRTYDLDTLGDDETIARLATGIRRFRLPDEYDFPKIWRRLADGEGNDAEQALLQLTRVHENRRQYVQAAKEWRENIERFGPGPNDWKRQALEQIVGNWGSIEPIGTAVAGRKTDLTFKFRNASRVDFTAQALDVPKLLADVKDYLKRNPNQLDWNRITPDNIGYRLVNDDGAAYLVGEPIGWTQPLEPLAGHYDRRVTVQVPELKGGAYLIESKVADGNATRFILWVADAVLVRKNLDGRLLYWVADAANGTPIGRADLEFFGYRIEQIDNGNRFRTLTSNFALRADGDGIVLPEARDLSTDYQWMTIARGPDRQLAFLGFDGVWTAERYDAQYEATKSFVITDRPVYRPGQAMQFKVWVGHAKYDQEGPSPLAGQAVPVTIMDPEGNQVFEAALTADEFGGVASTFEIPEGAKLGQYFIQIGLGEIGGNTFRVEEYKKPEYEVTIDAPSEPMMLGEKVKATIRAKYYFGAPVTEGTVAYKITRSQHSTDWYPVAPWDWCFGPGYWWFAYDYAWYPGYRDWVGCSRPAPYWIWSPPGPPPEIVAEDEVEIGSDGTLEIEIDSAVAKALMSNIDHRYEISAEVRDASRRTIVGTGSVIAARKPFRVFTWLDRGYVRVGQDATARLQARTADGKPVAARGEWVLAKIAYDEQRKPIETPVATWEARTDEQGEAELRFDASAPGQYRLIARLTDAGGHQVEGAYVFTIIGDGFDGRDYRFEALELIPERKEYAPGESVALQINTDAENATVLLFVKASNGVVPMPKVVRLQGRSAVEAFEITKRDMPNCFVEAVTVAGGQVFTEVREIVVPPEERVLTVDVLPSAERYRPGDKASVTVQVKDHTGENFRGSTVVAIYDKSVEAIAGGTNTPDIREFFWKWRRDHQPQTQSSVLRFSGLLYRNGETIPSPIGIFGNTVADEMEMLEKGGGGFPGGPGGMGGGMGGGFDGRMMRGGPPMPAMMEMADAAPMARAMGAMAGGPMGGVGAEGLDLSGGTGAAPAWVEPTVRRNFADTALWVGRIDTDATGKAVVELDMPENLTTWKVKVWGMGAGTRVGAGEVEVVTSKDLLIRLQAPRFFVERDEVVLSAIVHNYLTTEKSVKVGLQLGGESLVAIDPTEVDVVIPAGGEQRVDWRVRAEREGEVTITMSALTDEESDAMEMSFPVRIHGAPKMESWAGTVRPEATSSAVEFVVPSQRRVADSRLEVRYSPTLAGAMIDALPYLADYPYGCTEQTLNRWLPTVVTQKVLIDMGVDLESVKEHRTNLNAQEIGDDRERAAQWKRFDVNPVFDSQEVDRMVRDGLKKLAEMQVSDGGWGWFSGYGERSWPHTTAVVVHGLQLARDNDVPLVPGMLERGIEWLENYRREELLRLQNEAKGIEPRKKTADDLDALVHGILVDEGSDSPEMAAFLYRDRNGLSVYSKALFALACHRTGDAEKLAMLRRNIEQFLVQDAENETAYLKLPDGNAWWYWHGDEIETDVAYLKLLSKVDPRGETAPRLVKYLLNNRKHATYWNSTRDTAFCIEAFADYLKATGEMKPDMTVEVVLDGEVRKTVKIDSTNLFTFDNRFVLEGEQVTDGAHKLEIRRSGDGPVYFNTYLENFSLEDRILAAGLEVKVQRRYWQLVPARGEVETTGDRGQIVTIGVEKFERRELSDLSQVVSGDLIEVELIVDSKNDYEYLLFEDPKPAGCEAVEQLSGYASGGGMGAYVEYRDEKVAFFVRRLERGTHSLTYRLRAEIPGRFSALPTQASAMYAPELRGNADELRLVIEDKE